MRAALDYAQKCWTENLKTGRDDARIEQILGRKLTGDWCGWFAQACYKAAGLIDGVDLGSVYRVRETARYRDEGLLKLWCVVAPEGIWCARRVQDYHAAFHQPRKLIRWDAKLVEPGDLVLHEAKPGSSTGHLMLFVASLPGAVRLLGGNQRGKFPDSLVGRGVTCKELGPGDPYLTWIVRLSPLDFDPGVKLCKTQAEAEALAAKLNGVTP